ncbi:34-kDa subunit of RNA polymerase III (C) [Apiotrichum porosum]|uniref:34-kDa subunit of RNA polymerase III (C) n=1 Tax=Apiotrichum porosum TaxID=105984 RepID=A0A427XIH4_9TREE|nr:34-kDa subunit of RNA polymerase III (C) [Apiotrichum porosum]RSH78709.1 34-kDa subunit of RNA polymerase III (C) [Apiotrichum porosum]
MSATLSSTEQKVYNKVMASKKKAMTLVQIEAAIPGLSKKEMNTSINNILRLKLFTATKNKDDVLIFHAVAVEDAKRQNTLTEEQQFVLSIVEKAGNKGIGKTTIANQVSAELMARSQVFKSLEALEKSGLIKTFKSVNAPTMPLYILAHLKPPEDIAGGVWFDESKEYDSVFVDSLRMVVFNYVQHKKKDAISSLCPNPINPVSKTPALPSPQDLLRHILMNKVTSAKLTVKNVMEIARALELDGLIEAIKPVGGVSVTPMDENSDSDGEPVHKRSKKRAAHSDDDLEPAERDRRERKNREKLKAKMEEQKRERRRRERARDKEKEKERRKKEKEKEKKRKAKEKKRKEKERRKKKEKEKKKSRLDSDDDSDDSDDLREIGDDKPKRKRRAVASSDDSDNSSASSSDSDSDSDSSSSSSDDDSDVSSVMSDDIDGGDFTLKSKSGGMATMGISSNPFFSADGRQTLIDLSDQAVVYRATRRLHIPLGEMQAPCGTCPQFNFCEEDGPVNPAGCSYFSDWLSGVSGGWTADVKAEKAKKAAEEEKARRIAAAEASGETLVEEPEGDDEDAADEDDGAGEYDDGEAQATDW